MFLLYIFYACYCDLVRSYFMTDREIRLIEFCLLNWHICDFNGLFLLPRSQYRCRLPELNLVSVRMNSASETLVFWCCSEILN